MLYGERAQSELTLLLLHGSRVARMQQVELIQNSVAKNCQKNLEWSQPGWSRTRTPKQQKRYSRMYIIHLLRYPYTTIGVSMCF